MSTVPLTHDAFVRDGSEQSLPHNTTTLSVKNDIVGWRREAFVMLDTSSIPSNANISAAKLMLYGGGSNETLHVLKVADTSWTESGLTYSTKPGLGAFIDDFDVTASNAQHQIDVLSYINSERAAGRTTIAMAIVDPTTSVNTVNFNSAEASSNPAHVDVTYTVPPPPPPPPAGGETVNVRAAEDTYVRDGTNAGNSYGSDGTIQVKWAAAAGSNRKGLLKFSTSSFSSVQSATLTLWGYVSNASQGNVTVAGSSISNHNWTESITWSQANTAGLLTGGTYADSNVVSGTTQVQYVFDVTSVVAAAKANGDPFVSFRLDGEGISEGFALFISDENTTFSSKYPVMSVTQQAPANNPPSVGTPGASLNAAKTEATLSVTATDDGQTQPLSYNWVTVAKPEDSTVVFASGTSASTGATFDTAGEYVFRVDVSDGEHTVQSSQVTVNVQQVLATAIYPAAVTVSPYGSHGFVAVDQFGAPMIPVGLQWSLDADGDAVDGTIDGEGWYLAPSSGTGSDTVRVSDSVHTATAVVSVTQSLALATPGSLHLTGTAWADAVDLAWTDNATNEDYYVVEWSPDGSQWHVIQQLPANSTSYLDEYPVIGADNHYRVQAVSSHGAIVSAPVALAPIVPIAPPVAWHDDNGGANNRGTLSPYVTVHDTPLTLAVLPNDVDYDGANKSIVNFSDSANGSLVLNQDGTFTYTPDAGFAGTDTFTYSISDGSATGAPSTVAIDVTNAVPQANRQDHELRLNVPLMIDGVEHPFTVAGTASGSDGDLDQLTYEVVTGPEHGSVDFDEQTGEYVYTANGTFFGFDRFMYVAKDGVGQSQSHPTPVSIFSHTALVLPSRVIPVGPGSSSGVAYGVWNADIRTTPITSVQHGTLTGIPGGPAPYQDYNYTPNAFFEGDDRFLAQMSYGPFTSKPVTVFFSVESNPDTSNWWDATVWPVETQFIVSNTEPTQKHYTDTGWKWPGCDATLAMGQSPAHGQITFPGHGGFTYTPNAPAEGEDAYTGWDFFSFVVTQPWGAQIEQWVQLSVGDYVVPTTPRPESEWPARSIQPASTWQPASSPPSYDDLRKGYAAAKHVLQGLYDELAALGTAVKGVADATDPEVLTKIDAASPFIDSLAQRYDNYVDITSRLNTAAGAFQGDQLYVSQDDYDIVMAIQGLPMKVGSLSLSKQHMEQLAESLEDMGRGADIAVDTANKVVRFAEDSKKVLDGVQLAAGGGILITTGARLLVQEGLKSCAKLAAKELMQETASSVAAELMGYASSLLGLSPEQQRWIQIGVDSYQIFSLFKAAKTKVDWNGECFVAGTQVVTGFHADGTAITKNIEDIAVGDLVISRDQHNALDTVEARPVTRVFRKTSDHVRVVTIEGDDGNVETIRTTDEHPFWTSDRGWVAAGDLRTGDRVQESDGTWQIVRGCTREAHADGITVYNMEVESDHTYFVGDGEGAVDAIWVHNVCRTPKEAVEVAIKSPSSARKDLAEAMHLPAGQEAHHLIPVAALDQSDVGTTLLKAARGGFHFNGTANGRAMPSGHGWGTSTPTHTRYTADVVAEVRQRIALGKIYDDASAASEIADVAAMFRGRIDSGTYWPLPLP